MTITTLCCSLSLASGQAWFDDALGFASPHKQIVFKKETKSVSLMSGGVPGPCLIFLRGDTHRVYAASILGRSNSGVPRNNDECTRPVCVCVCACLRTCVDVLVFAFVCLKFGGGPLTATRGVNCIGYGNKKVYREPHVALFHYLHVAQHLRSYT